MGDNPFEKLKDLAEEHGDQIEGTLDKIAGLVDDKTGHKHTDKIESAVEKAKGFLGTDDGDNKADNKAGDEPKTDAASTPEG